MFRIAVCEDETAQREYITKLLETWQEKTGEPVLTDTYTSAEQFLFETEGKDSYHLLLLDIQMGQMNGMELARKVRERDGKVGIVFLTGIREYAIEGYEVGAIRYLLKPVKEEDFFALMQQIKDAVKEQEQDYFFFQAAGATHRVPFAEILYAEAEGHYVCLKTADKEWKWKENISSLAVELEKKGFFLLRRGLYVNLAQVSQIGKTECVLENGECLPVSKARYRALNEAFIAFYKNGR